MTRAWKFLDERSKGIFSGFVWPHPGADGDPGPWVEAGEAVICEQGVHACAVDQLAWWMSAQLWEIELAGPITVEGPKIVAERGRLIRLVGDWPDVGTELAAWAVWRVRDHAAAGLLSLGEGGSGARLAATTSFVALGEASAAITHPPDTPAGMAIAQVADALGDIANPIFACWDAARAAGHRASAVDRSVTSYKGAFAAERVVQSRWIADRLRLAG